MSHALLAASLLASLPHPAHVAPKPPQVKGKVIRTIKTRVTMFYSFKGKDGKIHKMASVSKTVSVRLVKPLKKAARRLDKSHPKR